MINFLLSLLPDFLKVYLGIKVSTAEALGEAEEKDDILTTALKNTNARAQESAQAPLDDAEVDNLASEGRF